MELIAELIEAHHDSMELLLGAEVGLDARWHVCYLQEQVRTGKLHIACAGESDFRDGAGPLLNVAEELLESHLDTVELLVDLRATDEDLHTHVAYLQSLQREGRAMVARVTSGGPPPASARTAWPVVRGRPR